MSALAYLHIPETKRVQLTIPISELRKNDVIISGVEIDKPVTVTQVYDPEYDYVDMRSLALINDDNQMYFIDRLVESEVTILDKEKRNEEKNNS